MANPQDCTFCGKEFTVGKDGELLAVGQAIAPACDACVDYLREEIKDIYLHKTGVRVD